MDETAVAIAWTERDGACCLISMRQLHQWTSGMSDWIDLDDASELTDELANIAGIEIGGKVIRPAMGYFGPVASSGTALP